MGVFNGLFPVLAGKEDAARAFASETMGARRADFDAMQGRSDITRETWSLQETPAGSFMLVWFEGDVERGFSELATDSSDFGKWFRGQIQDVTGLDMSAPSDEAPPAVLLDWTA